jgi:hypothetical protein
LTSPTTPHSDTPSLFRTGSFRQSDVVGLEKDFELTNIPDAALRTRLQALLRELQLSSDPPQRLRLQRELDSHLYVVALLVTESPTAQLVPLELLRLSDMSWIPTYDMGAVIREIVLEPHSNAKTVMAKIVQYCMPYIKHNRLNFPDFQSLSHAQLVAMMHIMAATCFGAYGHVQRRCTWNIRVSLFWLFWNILHTSNAQDMFIFCKTHMSLLRLCIIEYFIFFMREYMPTELMFMDRILGLTAGVHHVFKQFTLIVDSFRQMALQDSELNFSAINAKAQTCIDKCNRLCKGKSKSVCKLHPVSHQKYSLDIAMRSMRTPRMPTVLHALCHDEDLTPQQAKELVSFQRHICIHPMPYNIQCQQAKAILGNTAINTRTTYQSSFLYYCLRCQEHTARGITNAKMRVSGSTVACAGCASADSVLRVNTVGRIVSILNNTFYYCGCCMQVHAWHVASTDISTCRASMPAPPKPTHNTSCLVCSRNTNAPPMQVLDDELGVMQTLILCPKHRPPAHEQHVVHNLAALVYYFSAQARRPSKTQSAACW